MRRLHPAPAGPVDPVQVYGHPPAGRERPGVRVNMIASADGAAAVDGASGGLGGPADRRVFLLLRSLADVVLVGAATVRAEGYGPVRLPGELVRARERRGQAALPRVAVVSRSCRLDWDSPFFTQATSRPIVVTAAEAPGDRLAEAADVADVLVAGVGRVDLAEALATLGRGGARAVLGEGGPSLNGQLAAAGLLDELCLTVAPALVGGDAGRIVGGARPHVPAGLRLASVCEEDGYLFLRYGVVAH